MSEAYAITRGCVMTGLLYDEPFVAVFPSLIRALGGDAAAAAVLQHINFRSRSPEAIEHDGFEWFPVTREDLADEIGLSVKQVKRILGKLQDAGFLLAQQLGGHDRRNYYRIPKRADALVPNGTDGMDPNGTDGTDPYGTDVLYIEDKNKDLRIDTPSDRFDEFWSAYPRKAGKGQARKAWEKAIRKADPMVIIDAAAAYRDDPNRDEEFTAHPSTWLNGERWLDDPLPARSGGAGDRNRRDLEGLVARAAEREARRAVGGSYGDGIGSGGNPVRAALGAGRMP